MSTTVYLTLMYVCTLWTNNAARRYARFPGSMVVNGSCFPHKIISGAFASNVDSGENGYFIVCQIIRDS